jgi:hypothetical protein
MTDIRRRSTDKKTIIHHFRDNWIQWLILIGLLYNTIGNPVKTVGTWAYKLGTLRVEFDSHCKSDSLFRLDVYHWMDASAAENKKR